MLALTLSPDFMKNATTHLRMRSRVMTDESSRAAGVSSSMMTACMFFI